jgi:hypothetical protein
MHIHNLQSIFGAADNFGMRICILLITTDMRICIEYQLSLEHVPLDMYNPRY